MKQVKHFMKDSFMNFGVFPRLNFVLTTKVKTTVGKPQSLGQITNFFVSNIRKMYFVHLDQFLGFICGLGQIDRAGQTKNPDLS